MTNFLIAATVPRAEPQPVRAAGQAGRRGAGRRRDRDGGATREDILQAAFALFARHGYDGVSVGAVAEAADITKAALYWHFASKDALYVECLVALQAIYREHVFAPADLEADPGQRPVALFEGIARLLADPRIRDGVAGYWLKPSTTDLALAGQTQMIFEEDAGSRVVGILEAAVATGALRDVGDAGLLARAVVGIVVAAVLPLQSHTPTQTAELLGALARIFFRAYAPPTSADKMAAEAAARIRRVLAPLAAQSQIEYETRSSTVPA
jgi:AcrR family transcriptional regulator